MVVKINTY